MTLSERGTLIQLSKVVTSEPKSTYYVNLSKSAFINLTNFGVVICSMTLIRIRFSKISEGEIRTLKRLAPVLVPVSRGLPPCRGTPFAGMAVVLSVFLVSVHIGLTLPLPALPSSIW